MSLILFICIYKYTHTYIYIYLIYTTNLFVYSYILIMYICVCVYLYLMFHREVASPISHAASTAKTIVQKKGRTPALLEALKISQQLQVLLATREN